MFKMRSRVALALAALASALVSAPVAQAADLSDARFHITANIASYHYEAAQNFEETNPGLGFGFTLPISASGAEIGAEIGRYRNSVGGWSNYATASYDTPVAQTRSAALRLGVFSGMAHYDDASSKFAGGGVPMVGDWVVVAGAQATVRIDEDYDIRVRALPAGKAAKVLFTLQVAHRF